MPTPSQAFAVAITQQQDGQFEAADRTCREILAMDPQHADALHLLGVIASQTGRPEAAIEWINRAISCRGTDAVFHSNLGSIYRDLGRLDDAAACCRRALELKPDHAAAHYNLGNALLALGVVAEGIESFHRAIELRPDFTEAYGNLASALLAQKKLDEAIACCRQALARNSNDALARYNLGLAFQASGNLDEAIASFQLAAQLRPEMAEAHFNLGSAYQSHGMTNEAVASYKRVLSLQPGHAETYNNLGTILQSQGQLNEAVACFRRALELAPRLAQVHINLGNVLCALRRADEAVACYGRALELNPSDPVASYNLSTAYQALGQLDEAIACCRRVLEQHPDHPQAHNNMGAALSNQRKQDDAIACFQRALTLKPDFPEAWSNYLFALQYRDGANLAELSAAHADCERLMTAPLRATWRPHQNSRDPDRPLRLGFISSDFGLSPVGFFTIGVIENLDHGRWEAICYSDRTNRDELTDRFEAAATTWRDVRLLKNQDLSELIRADQIDILFDLAGHTANNRLLVFDRKPAPIQITWAGYAGTTGLAAMDYILADRWEIPPEAERYYRERVLRMPDGYVCFEPPSYSPDVSSLPALTQGFVTFGSCNNPPKITARVIEVWANILGRIPQSRLVMRFRGLSYPSTARQLTAEFANHGIDPRRIDCLGWSPHRQLLEEYNRIDIALDPFPYNGGLTTCEALLMGVPVITCPGETFASRHSLSHLSNVGLTETIARDLDGYVELAAELASDLPRLAALRASLRHRVAASPLCDAQRFAENLTQLLRDVWRTWCQEVGK